MYDLDSDNGRWICNHCDQYFPEECKCKKLPKTHDGKCWVRHAECAIAKVNGLQARADRMETALKVIGSHGKDYGGEWCQNEAEAALRGEEV